MRSSMTWPGSVSMSSSQHCTPYSLISRLTGLLFMSRWVKCFLPQGLGVCWSLYLWFSSSHSLPGQTLSPRVSLVSLGRPSLAPAAVTLVLLLTASSNLLCRGLLNRETEKLRIALLIFPCCLSSECDLCLPDGNSHGSLEYKTELTEKEGVRHLFLWLRS